VVLEHARVPARMTTFLDQKIQRALRQP